MRFLECFYDDFFPTFCNAFNLEIMKCENDDAKLKRFDELYDKYT
jgi:hypothetical protein